MDDEQDVTPDESTPSESLAVNQGFGQSPMDLPPSASAPATITDISKQPWNVFPDANPQEIAEAKYPGIANQALAAGIGLTKGAIPLGGALLQKVGYDPQELQDLKTAYPITSGAGEVAGFLAPAIASFGASSAIKGAAELTLPGLIGKIGQGVSKIPGVSKFAASGVVPKMLTSGITGSLEMTALGANNEISDLITKDPDEAVDYAKIGSNLKSDALFGLAFGTGLGTVSGLWNKASNIMQADKVANDFMGESTRLANSPEPVNAVSQELQTKLAEADEMRTVFTDSKPEILQKAMPEVTPENSVKIDGQIQDISDAVQKQINDASLSVKTKNAVPHLQEDLDTFQEAVTHPDATYATKFQAANKLKQTLEGYAKWATGLNATEETTAKGALGRTLSNVIRPALEDTSVWGKAGTVQRVMNEGASNMIKAAKDFRPQIMENVMGENQIAPQKVQTLVNQATAGKVARKATVVGNFLDAMQKQADAMKKVHLDNGLEPPPALNLNPTPTTDALLNTEVTPGVKLARWVHAKGGEALGKAISEGGAGAIGAGLGALAGQPLLGAWASEKILAPIFSNFAKPFAENAMNSTAAKATIDYLGNVVRGKNIVAEATNKFFKPGVEILKANQLPNDQTRAKVEKNIGGLNDDSDAMWAAGSNISHYLPSHGMAIAQQTAQGLNYLNSLKPKPIQMAALDAMVHPGSQQLTKYNRALDVAHEPLIVLHKAKEGTLLPSDLQSLDALHPGMRKAFVSNLTKQLIDHQSGGGIVPYRQRASLNLIMGGAPIDSTFSVQGMQAILKSASPPVQQQSGGPGKKGGHASTAALSQMSKNASLYATPDQSRALERRS